jgi:hypothetical protein
MASETGFRDRNPTKIYRIRFSLSYDYEDLYFFSIMLCIVFVVLVAPIQIRFNIKETAASISENYSLSKPS